MLSVHLIDLRKFKILLHVCDNAKYVQYCAKVLATQF